MSFRVMPGLDSVVRVVIFGGLNAPVLLIIDRDLFVVHPNPDVIQWF